MPAKLSIEHVRITFQENGCQLLSIEYINNNTPLLFKCSCGNIASIIYNNFLKRKRCNKCGRARQAKNFNEKRLLKSRLSYQRPELKKDWDFSKNGNLTPDLVNFGSRKKVWWIGSICGHEWIASICDRSSGSGCHICTGRSVNNENCLATIEPLLLSEWNYQKNILTPFEVTANSGKTVWWLCKSGHEWEATINSKGKCPYCIGQKVCHDNNLEFMNPILAMEWHPTKNGNLSPKQFTVHSNKNIWWRGKCGHEWQTAVSARSNGKNCPYCAGVKLDISNSLAIKYPSLLSEWNYAKNEINPEEIASGSGVGVWWICPVGHEWKVAPLYRTRAGSGCPHCKKSHGEDKIARLLVNLNLTVKQQYRIAECRLQRTLPFDFAIFDSQNKLLLLVEYDGQQHFAPISVFGGEEQFEKQLIKDSIKNDFCLNHNILLLRIRFDDNIEGVLMGCLDDILIGI